MGGLFKQTAPKRGVDLLLKAQLGEELSFTRIVLGDGYLPEGQNLEEIEKVVSEVVSITSLSMKVENGAAIISGPLTPDMVPYEFYYRELGLYVLDPETGEEILYSYGNSGDTAEVIRPDGQSDIVERTIDIVVTVGNAENITIVLDNQTTATLKHLEELKAALEEKHDSDIENMNALIDEVDKNIKELEDAAERSDQAHEEAAETLQSQIDEAKEQHTADVNALSRQIQEAANEMAAFEEEYAENANAVLERLSAIDEACRQASNALGERITALSNTHSSDMQSIETSIDVLKNNTGDKITFISFDQDTQAYTSSRSFTETGRLYLTSDQMPADSYFDMTIIAHINGGVRSSDSSETASAVFGLKAYNDTSTLDSTTLVSEKTASLKSVHQESSYSHEGLGIDSGVVMMINAKNLTNSKSWTITVGHNVVSGGTAYTYSINIVVLIKKHSSVVSG